MLCKSAFEFFERESRVDIEFGKNVIVNMERVEFSSVIVLLGLELSADAILVSEVPIIVYLVFCNLRGSVTKCAWGSMSGLESSPFKRLDS